MKKKSSRKRSYCVQPDPLIDRKYASQSKDKILSEIKKCSNGLDGVKYFINNYIYVPNKIQERILKEKPTWFKHLVFEGDRVNLKLYQKQEEFLDEIFNNRLVSTIKSRQCLPKGSMIFTPTGPKEIQDLKSGDSVYSLNEETNEIEIDTVIDAWKSGNTKCNQIRTFSRNESIQGENHPFLMDTGDYALSHKIRPGNKFRSFDVNLNNDTYDEIKDINGLIRSSIIRMDIPITVYSFGKRTIARFILGMLSKLSDLELIVEETLQTNVKSSDRTFLMQIKQLLWLLNIPCGIYKFDQLWMLSIHRYYISKLTQILITDEFIDSQIEAIKPSNESNKIQEVHDIGELECYDIEVEKNKNFIFEGMVVHNTGISTITQAYILQYATFNDNKEIVIISKSETEAIKFLDSIYYMYNHLPFFLRRSQSKAVKKSFHLGTLNSSTKISVLTSTAKSGRSFSATVLVIDECSSFSNKINILDEWGQYDNITIEELFNRTQLKDTNIKVQVWDGARYVYDDIVEVKETGIRDVIKYYSILNLSNEFTQNHPIYTIDGTWTSIKDCEFMPVTLNDEYFQNSLGNRNKSFIDGMLFGYMYGDGQINEKHSGVSGSYKDLMKFIDVLFYRLALPNSSDYHNNIKTRNCRLEQEADTISTHLPIVATRYFMSLGMPCGKKIHNSFTLPDQIFDSTDAIAGYQNGTFAAEGTVSLQASKKRSNSLGKLRLTCFYKDISNYDSGIDLLESMEKSLCKIGITGATRSIEKIVDNINKQERYKFCLHLSKQKEIFNFLHIIGMIGFSFEKEMKRIGQVSIFEIRKILESDFKGNHNGFRDNKYNIELIKGQTSKMPSFKIFEYYENVTKFVDRGIVFVPILKKEYLGKQQTYNIHMKNIHTYIANNVVTHNCEFIDHVDTLWSAAQPTLSATGGQGICISTPQNYKSQFQKICHGEEGGGAFVPFRIHQSDIPGRDKEWYEDQCKELGNDPMKIKTELDQEQIIPFTKYFNEDQLKESFIIKKNKLYSYEKEWNLNIIRPFDSSVEYYFGIDTYEGGNDFNAGVILGNDLRIYASFKTQRIDIYELVIRLCDEYHCKANIERNRGFQLLKEFYDSDKHKEYLLYRKKKYRSIIEDYFGYVVSDNRKQLIATVSNYLKNVFNYNNDHPEDMIYIPEDLMHELKYFVIKKTKIEGLEHDDMIFALIAAIFASDNKKSFINFYNKKNKLVKNNGLTSRVAGFYDAIGNVTNPRKRNQSIINEGKLNAVIASNFLSQLIGKKNLSVIELDVLEKLVNIPVEEENTT